VIKCNEIPPFNTNRVSTLVRIASISEFSKKVLSITDQFGRQKNYLEPGDSINYEIRIKSNSSFPITVDRFEDLIPKHARVVGITAPPGSVNESTQSTIVIKNISFEPYGAQYIRYTLRVDTVAEWGNIDPINGYQIKNQGKLSGSSLDRVYLSDDPTTPVPSDPTVLIVRYGSDLSSSSKSVVDVNGGTPEPGDELLYTITVRNTGTRTVGIQVEDTLSTYAEFMSIDSVSPSQIKYSVSGNRLFFYNFSLASNETALIRYRVRISYAIPPGSVEFRNTARIYSTDEPNYFIDVSASLTVVSGPNISVFQKGAKINGVETRSGRPGDKIDYSITIRNTGNGAANNVIVEDIIDANLIVDTASISDGGKFVQGKIRWEYLTIGVGITRTLRFSATVNVPIENNTIIKNQASLYSQDIKKIFSDDPTTSVLGDSTDITIRFAPQIKNVFKFVNNQKSIWARGGDIVTFTLEFENDSPGPLRNLVLSDSVSKLLKNVELVTSGGTVDANQTINWNIPVLGYKEKKTFVFKAEVRPPSKPSTVITNFGTVIAGTTYSRNTDTVTIYVYDEPNFSNTFKYASYDGDYSRRTHNANAGDTLVFSIMVKNSGPVMATGVRISDPIDSRISEVSEISDGGMLSGNEVIWNIPAINSNETRTVSFKGKIKSPLSNGTRIYNQARIISNETKEVLSDDPDTPASPDPLVITVSSSPYLVLNVKAKNKSGEEVTGVIRPTDEIDFVIEISNTGNSMASDVVVYSYIDKDRFDVVSVNNGGFTSGNQVVWNISSLDIGETNKKSLSYRVKIKECVSGKIVNYAEATSREVLNPVRSNIVELSIDNTAKRGKFYKRLLSPREVKPNETVIYELSYETDDISLCDAVITDVLPDTLQILSSSSGKISGNTITLDIKQLNMLKPVRIEARLKSPIKDQSVVKNQAYIEASNYKGRLNSDDPDTNVPDDPTEFRVRSAADIYLVKTADVSEVSPGGTINYSLLILNTGTDYARDITVMDTFDEMWQYIKEVVPKGEGVYNPDSHTLIFTMSELGIAPQYYKRFEFSVVIKSDVPDGTILYNQSITTGSNYGKVLSDNNVEKSDGIGKTVVTVVNRPGLYVSKTPYRLGGALIRADETVSVGEEFIYKLMIKNDSEVEAREVVITDEPDKSLVEILEVSSGGKIDNGGVIFDYTISQDLKSLKKGEKAEFWYKVRVKIEAKPDSEIVNQALVRCSNSKTVFVSDDDRTTNKNDPTIVRVKRYNGPYFASSKKEYIAKTKPIKAGDKIDFVISVINSGDVASTETKIYDEITRYGWEYVKGSTKLNGRQLSDVGGRSPLESGLLINSVRYEGSLSDQGVVGPVYDGGIEKNIAVVEFSAIVPKNVSVMKNSARLTYKGGEYLIPEIQIPVGDNPLITTLLKEYSLSSDKNGNSVADIGDNIRFYLRFKNEGSAPAKRIEITDILPNQASYLSETMKITINGITKSLTDLNDSDEGALVTINGQIANRFVIRELPADAEVLITFDAVVNVCGGFLNQAELVYENGRILSDYDGNSSNGVQKTYVATCELSRNYYELYKTAIDNDGGKVEPSDKITFRISITSQGNSLEEEVTFMDDVPQFVKFSGKISDILLPEGANFNYVPPPAGRYNNGLIIVKGMRFGSGRLQGADIIFNVNVNKEAKYGDLIENKAVIYNQENKYFESNTVRLTVGGEVGLVSVQGILYRKMNRNENRFNYDTDILLPGYRIEIDKITNADDSVLPPPGFKPVDKIYTDSDGKFVILNLKKGKYRIYAYNEKDSLIGIKDVDLSEGSLTNVEFGIVPTGVVYSSERYLPVENLKVIATSEDGHRKEFITDRFGIYWFDFEKKSYKLDVVSGDGSYIFPSVLIPPDNSLRVDKDGYVSGDFAPKVIKDKKYITEVDFRKSGVEKVRLVNNNLPVDSSQSLITFYKVANKNIVSKGELIEYSLFVRNGTAKDLNFYIWDEPDNGLIIKSKEFGVATLNNSVVLSEGKLSVRTEKVKSKILYKTDEIMVRSQETKVIKYFAYAGFDYDVLKLSNRSTLFERSGRVIKSAYNTVYVRKDYDFESSMVFGRVFCDENENGKFDYGEMGIHSAKIMLDTGVISISDVHGLYHFPELHSGYHVIKIDKSSLPAGFKPINESVDLYLTNGLPVKVNYPLLCEREKRVIKETDFYKTESDFTQFTDKEVSGSKNNEVSAGTRGNTQKAEDKIHVISKAKTDTSEVVGNARIKPQVSENKGSGEIMESIIYIPKDKITSSDRVLISGRIGSRNRLFYKNNEIKTSGGSFSLEIPLEYGKNKIVVDIVDSENRVSNVFFEIERVEREPFILAYFTGLLSNSDFVPDGALPSTHLQLGGIGLDGKAVIYAKHQMRNKWGFKDIDITLHFDSSKMREREFNLLENRLADYMYYPTFGDSSTLIKDVNSIDKLYLRIEADKNRLIVGNFNTQISGIEQFRYEKQLYGMSLSLDNKFERYHTSNYSKLFVGVPVEYSRHKKTILKATGGSVYFLGASDIINGSENIRIVIKDALTGDIVYEKTLVRYTDYTLNYSTGTLFLNQPLNSYIDTPSSITLSANPSGNVYIVAEYDYFTLTSDDNYSVGVYARENFDNRLDVSGGIVNEFESGDTVYRLYSIGISMKYLKHSSFRGEFAASKFGYSDYLFSPDGGISGRALAVESRDGYSALLETKGDLADLLLKDEKMLSYRLFFRMNTPYFASANTLINQGIKSGGMEVAKGIDKKLSASLNLYLHYIEPLSLATMERMGDISLYSTQQKIKYKLTDKIELLSENLYSYSDFNTKQINKSYSTDIFGLGSSYQMSQKISIFGSVHSVFFGDENEFNDMSDRIYLTLGSTYKVKPKLYLTLSDTFRFNLDNYTQISARTPVSETGSVYFGERVGSFSNQFIATSILGAEEQLSNGISYILHMNLYLSLIHI
ncbi:MAG: DUF11 domain-containing protein, partial [Deltaproteobacteria bacterium]|nr:DUF11 domain-containing protein [Deltaproteobacteria bacterium]